MKKHDRQAASAKRALAYLRQKHEREDAATPAGSDLRQTEIPGTAPKRIAALDAQVRLYLDRKRTIDSTKELLDDSSERIAALLREHKLAAYRFVDGEEQAFVTLEETERVKVKRAE